MFALVFTADLAGRIPAVRVITGAEATVTFAAGSAFFSAESEETGRCGFCARGFLAGILESITIAGAARQPAATNITGSTLPHAAVIRCTK